MNSESKRTLRAPNESEISAVLKQNSDFAFEMLVLHLMGTLGFMCKHSGIYVDTIKARNREFDIRGEKILDNSTRLWVAVECKNIIMNPLIIHRVPRQASESFHDILFRTSELAQGYDGVRAYHPTDVRRLGGSNTPYQPNALVGKAMDQVVSDGRKGLKLSDGEIFDKFSQALSSLASLVADVPTHPQKNFRHALLAILVVPDGSLWATDYSNGGDRTGGPAQVSRVQYFVGNNYPFRAIRDGVFCLSHLEIITPSAFGELLNTYCKPYVNHAPLFPQDQ